MDHNKYKGIKHLQKNIGSYKIFVGMRVFFLYLNRNVYKFAYTFNDELFLKIVLLLHFLYFTILLLKRCI